MSLKFIERVFLGLLFSIYTRDLSTLDQRLILEFTVVEEKESHLLIGYTVCHSVPSLRGLRRVDEEGRRRYNVT